jgi:hypothetical protein
LKKETITTQTKASLSSHGSTTSSVAIAAKAVASIAPMATTKRRILLEKIEHANG